MDSNDIIKQIQSIIKQGYLHKQSRWFKAWRQRWIVLTNNLLLSYKQKQKYQDPTEIILVKDIMSVKSAEQQIQKPLSFRVDTNQDTFYFYANSEGQKQSWLGSIGKTMVKAGKKQDDD